MHKYFFLILIFISIISSCSETVIDDIDPPPIEEVVAYNPEIKAVIDNFCINCHNADFSSGGLNLSDYNLVRNATENANLIQRINDVQNPMPQSGLMPAEERALFDKWVDDGFPENQE